MDHNLAFLGPIINVHIIRNIICVFNKIIKNLDNHKCPPFSQRIVQENNCALHVLVHSAKYISNLILI